MRPENKIAPPAYRGAPEPLQDRITLKELLAAAKEGQDDFLVPMEGDADEQQRLEIQVVDACFRRDLDTAVHYARRLVEFVKADFPIDDPVVQDYLVKGGHSRMVDIASELTAQRAGENTEALKAARLQREKESWEKSKREALESPVQQYGMEAPCTREVLR